MKIAVITLAAAVAVVLWMLGGLGAIGYALLFALTLVPGLPLGFALFGPRHAAGWIAGLLLGYATTSLAWWAVVFARRPSAAAFVLAWVVATACVWASARALRRGATGAVDAPLVALPPWTRRDTTALALLLLIVPALVGRPFANLGSKDESGNRLYRAYFIADFVWHTALTAELAKETQPPRNPYLAERPVHYYWTYFRVPATLVAHGGFDVQQALKVNATGAALLFVAAIFLAAWAALPAWPFATASAVALTIVAPSIEGLAATVDLLRRGHSLSELRDLNIDAIAAWAYKGLRIDDLPRAMWYTPQHAISCALGLLAVPIAVWAGARASLSTILVAGLALGASLAFNPLVGVIFCLVYGLTIVIDAVRTRASAADVLKHSLAAAIVVVAYGWCALNQVGEGAVSALHFGYWGPARNATVLTFLLSFGPLLVLLAIGLWPGRGEPIVRFWPAILGLLLAVLLMHLVTLTVDQAWVGFRGGQIFFVLAPAIVARGLTRLWHPGLRRFAIAAVVFVLACGLPTTVIDAYNAQDVGNLKMGPGFHWTVSLTPDEQQALEWIRTHTPKDAVVQAEPVVRGRETWSLIPTWGERRMAAGNAIPLLNIPEYAEKSELVRRIYAGDDAKQAWELARQLGIDYLYVDAAERGAYPRGVAKFDAHPEFFKPVFRNGEASVYALR